MTRTAAAVLACTLLWPAAARPVADEADTLAPGLFLFAAPGLPDPNFARTVVLLIDHGPDGSLGVVVNQPTDQSLDALLDRKKRNADVEVPVYRGGPVQPDVVLALVRAPRPGPRARTVLNGVQLTRDFEDVEATLAERNGHLRVRVFAGYAGWAPKQLAAEVRGGSWVLEPADAASVFSPEPSRLWERVHEILSRVRV